MSGNKWHLLRDNEDKPTETLCGRTTKDRDFFPKTARLVTTDIKQFRERPCNACLKIFAYNRSGLYLGERYEVEDLLKKRRMGVL